MKDSADPDSRQCGDEKSGDGPGKASGFLIDCLECSQTWPMEQGKDGDREDGLPGPTLTLKKERQISWGRYGRKAALVQINQDDGGEKKLIGRCGQKESGQDYPIQSQDMAKGLKELHQPIQQGETSAGKACQKPDCKAQKGSPDSDFSKDKAGAAPGFL